MRSLLKPLLEVVEFPLTVTVIAGSVREICTAHVRKIWTAM
jgi:hypothetical protein